MKRDGTAPALERGLEILELLSKDPYEMGFQEISQRLRIPPASLWRLLKVLTNKGYVIVDPKRRTYRLGFKLASMGNFLLENSHFKSSVREELKHLVDLTGETVELDIKLKDQLVLLEQIIGPEGLYLYSHPGSAMPYFHATAPGKVYLANLPYEKLRAIVSRLGLPKLTTYTIHSFDQLLAELELVRERGYAFDIDEMREGVGRVASGIYDREGKVIAVIAVVCPSIRLRDHERLKTYGERVKEVAKTISDRHGRIF